MDQMPPTRVGFNPHDLCELRTSSGQDDAYGFMDCDVFRLEKRAGRVSTWTEPD